MRADSLLSARMPCFGASAHAAPAVTASANSEACAAFATFPNPEMLKSMRRGVNLPGWDNPDESERPTIAQLQALHDRGFAHIRLPLDEKQLSGTAKRCLSRPDVRGDHPAAQPGLHGVARSSRRRNDRRDVQGQSAGRRAASWRRLDDDRERVRLLDPARVAVELLNEPDMPSELWWPVAGRLSAEIRRILPSTTIVVGPAGPQRHEVLAGLEPLDDANVVYAIHYYDPFVFTHQGADWGGADDPLSQLQGLPYPATIGGPGRAGAAGGAQGRRPRRSRGDATAFSGRALGRDRNGRRLRHDVRVERAPFPAGHRQRIRRAVLPCAAPVTPRLAGSGARGRRGTLHRLDTLGFSRRVSD